MRVGLDLSPAWALAEDGPALAAAAPPRDAVRLLTNLDPLHAARDRELLVPDPVLRRRIWTALGGPGTVLVGGEVAGLWRAAKRGRRLEVAVEAVAALSGPTRDELAEEAQRLAGWRGADRAELRLSAA